MAVTYRSHTTPDSTDTPAPPADIEAGDLLLMHVRAGRVEVPEGWITIPNLAYGVNDGGEFEVFYRIATASEPATYTIVFDTGTPLVSIIAYQGAGDLRVEAYAAQRNVSDTDREWPAVTVTSDDVLVALFGVIGNSGTTPPAGFNERYDISNPRHYLADGAESGGPGAIGPYVGTGTAQISRCLTVALAEGEQQPFEGPQYRGKSSEWELVNGSKSLDVPPALAVGDFMLLQICFTSDKTPSVAGWTLVSATTGTENLYLFSKVAEADDVGGSVTATFAGGSVRCFMGIVAYFSPRGYSIAIDDYEAQSNASGTSHAFADLTLSRAPSALVYLMNIGATTTEDAQAVERWEVASGAGPRAFMMNSLFFEAGAAGTRTATTGIASASSTLSVALVEVDPPDDTLDASLTKWLRVQVGKQSSFDDPATPTFGLPVVFEYEQGDIEQIAAWDQGTWTNTEIVELVAEFAVFTLRGALFFEVLPVLLGAGFDAMTPSGDGPYVYSGSAGQAAVGAPAAYTFRFGGNQGSGGSMVQIQDAYLRQLTLSFNLNDKVVMMESEWFGRRIDDNDGAGYAPEVVPLPDGLTMVQGLLSEIGLQDAGETGGAFDDLDSFECSVIEWQLALDTGLRPLWAADQNGLSYCGVRHEEPTATWQPHIRTTAGNYAVVLTKAQARQHQEAQLTFFGSDREFVLQMTGRYVGRLNAHDRARGEVVMQPLFKVATPASQTTTPHWMSWTIESGWEHE